MFLLEVFLVKMFSLEVFLGESPIVSLENTTSDFPIL